MMYTIADADPAAVAEASDNGGFLGPIVGGLEWLLKILDSGFESMGVPYSYGFSIIALTILVKVFTFPLSKQQVESTIAMQKIQPKVKELQSKWGNDKERLQMETAKLYQDAGVNPLAGCLPTLATLPVFIGLYRALTNVADEGLLTDGFFWIPSLAGPTSIADRDAGDGFGWLSLVDGAPAIGWHDATAYLVLPIVLTISQYVSQKLMSPTPDGEMDEAQQQSQAILKFLPFMIGWFSLNVPSGLTLYWFTNNILTTAQTLYLRQAGAEPATAMAGSSGSSSSAASTVVDVEPIATVNPNGKGTQPQMSRKERRELERAEERGKRFAARKAAEKDKKKKKTPAEPMAEEESNTSA